LQDVSAEDLNIIDDEIARILENHQLEKLGSDPIYDDVYAGEILRILRETHRLHGLEEAAGDEGEEEEKSELHGSDVSENNRRLQVQKKTNNKVDCISFLRLLCRRLSYIREIKRRRLH